ncbi:MAG TPA: alpha/beta fold hydrolase [Euzebyales bacterium]|nr:alpha/beta fold hydrolase [Euzebyales bacterium]
MIARPDWLPPEQYPFTLRRRGAVAFIDEGAGPTLLFVHAGMWSFVFRDVITRLRTDFRCVALDFPGFGLAPQADDDASIADLAGVLTTFVTELDLRDVTVVANDLGGPVALATAAALPERVHGLVLANTFAWTPDHRALRAMLRVIGGRPAEAVGVTTNVVALLTSTRFGVGRHLDRAGRVAFRGPSRERHVRRRFHQLMASTLDTPAFTDGIDDAVTTVLADTPVLTIFGERNDPLGFQARLAERFADHEGVVVAGGNHFPMTDDPDLFAASVRDWHRRRVASHVTR